MAQLNPFQIFGLPASFELDPDQLEKKFIEIQRKVHPDRFANASDAEKRVAQQWTILINEAYQKLKDPLSRAMLLCELNGVKVDGDSSADLGEDFLLDQLERREAIDDAVNAGDEERIAELKSEVKGEADALLSQVAEAIDRNHDYQAAAPLLQKLMFLKRQTAELTKG